MTRSSTAGYSWLSAPGASALSLLFLHSDVTAKPFAGRLADASNAPRRVWLCDSGGQVIDEVMVARLSDGVLVTCHGGAAVRNAIERELENAGVAPVKPSDLWDRRARVQAATLELLPHAQGRLGASMVLQAAGIAVSALNDMGEGLPLSLDALNQARWLFAPPRVQLWGPVNSGKSSLLNALCGEELAAVAEEPGLTRDIIEGRFEHHGFEVRVFDAPGEMAGASGVDQAALELARRWKAEADLVIHLVPPGAEPPELPQTSWAVRSRIDESAGAATGVSVRMPETLLALKTRILEHFVGALTALPAGQRFALVPQLQADLREWAAGKLSKNELVRRWL